MEEQTETHRYTVVIWPTPDGYHAFIPAFEIALPEATSVEAMLESARTFVIDQLGAFDFSGDDAPPDVEVTVETIAVELDEQLRMPAELFAAILHAAVGDVITTLSDNRGAVAVLLDTLTSIAVLLQSDESQPFAPSVIWSEQQLQATVRETLDYRMESSDLTCGERTRLRNQMRKALERQFAIAHDLDLS